MVRFSLALLFRLLLIVGFGPLAFAVYTGVTAAPSGSRLHLALVGGTVMAFPHLPALVLACWLRSWRIAFAGTLGPNLAIVLISCWVAHGESGNGLEAMFYYPIAFPLALVGLVVGYQLDRRAARRRA